VLLPHVVRWRFPGQRGAPTSTERFLGAQRGIRNCFGRLWWRAELLFDEPADDPYHLLAALGEDELVQITERPSIAGCQPLAKALASGIANLPAGAGAPRMVVARETIRRVRRAAALIEVRALEPESLKSMVARAIDDALSAGSTAMRVAAEEPETYNGTATLEPELIVTKRLSANDLGVTGSHQSAIVVAPVQAVELAALNEKEVNPSALLHVRSADHPDTWTWRLIHYNGRRHGTSTRDEYRLTGVGAWMDWTRPALGDVVEMHRIDDRLFEVRIRRSE
jgi:hypothetical protein